jgi:dolichol-phosphate mannosyltransferase
MKLAIVVPTYNEALNLPLLVPRVLSAAPDSDIFVVDDASPDGTGEVAEWLARDHPGRVHVLHRPAKGGRGGAVLAGLIHACAAGDYEWFGEMDADLSHQPEELERLLAARDGADMVVASRYLPLGRTEGWSWTHRIWSRLANRLIKAVLRLPMSDVTNGYRLYSRDAVHHLAGQRLLETGYISLSEWAYTLHRSGMTIREVPTTFINRRLGTSKMSASEAIGALRGLFRIRRHISDP